MGQLKWRFFPKGGSINLAVDNRKTPQIDTIEQESDDAIKEFCSDKQNEIDVNVLAIGKGGSN